MSKTRQRGRTKHYDNKLKLVQKLPGGTELFNFSNFTDIIVTASVSLPGMEPIPLHEVSEPFLAQVMMSLFLK